MTHRGEQSLAISCLLAAVAALLFLMSMQGCATVQGLDKAAKYLPVVADGVHHASSTGQNVLHTICKLRANSCRKNGVDNKESCPGWLKCDAVRTALEAVTRGVEDDLVGLKSKFEAFSAPSTR
jgi:hypothetical protein